MRLVLLTVDGDTPDWVAGAREEYKKKIGHLFPFEHSIVKSPKMGRDQKHDKVKKEAELVLRALHPHDLIYVCDERGKLVDSLELSRQLERDFSSGRGRLVIVVGGAFGLSEEVKKRADLLWALSPLVLSHVVAQVVVLEQIYRALTIQKNLPYHNA